MTGRRMTINKSKTELFDKATLLHLRLPFSLYLMPIFCFALSQSSFVMWESVIIIFIALHLFIYPGSNIYNSYMDKDEGSIGGLENPPPVTKKLYYASIVFDSFGLLLGLVISWKFMLLLLVYISISKAYSWKGIRLKKFAITSWLVVALFQGAYTFMLVKMGVSGETEITWFTEKNILSMLIAALLVGGFYPLTQIYQHQEDSKRGDITISYLLGYRGTFIFSIILFIVACGLFHEYFNRYYSINEFYIFLLCMLPVIAFFIFWMIKVFKDVQQANFKNAMLINKVSAFCLIIGFTIIFWINHFGTQL